MEVIVYLGDPQNRLGLSMCLVICLSKLQPAAETFIQASLCHPIYSVDNVSLAKCLAGYQASMQSDSETLCITCTLRGYWQWLWSGVISLQMHCVTPAGILACEVEDHPSIIVGQHILVPYAAAGLQS